MDPTHITLMMTRRALLRDAVLMVGGAATVLPIDLWANSRATPRFFDEAEFTLLDEICEIIMPQTDTPGARGAGVPAALDSLIRDWASAEHQRALRALLKELDSKAVAAGGKPLLQLSPQQRLDVMTAYDAEHFSKPPYSILKNLVLRLYYLSEVGATQELRYEHVPGVWEPAVEVTPETRAWASPGPI
jgi:hypothetical protein